MLLASERLMRYLRFFNKLLTFCLIFIIFTACSKRQVSLPDYRENNLDYLLSELSQISSIEASIEVEFDKDDTTINGDMFLKADEKNMLIRLYYLGFPAGEIIEKEGEIRNTMKISKTRAELIAKGLKRSIFWWKNSFHQILDSDDTYTLLANGIEIIIDKKTLLPTRQTIRLDNGESLDIIYSEPRQIDEGKRFGGITDWYQSVLTLSYRNYRATSRINSLNILRD